jgi:hypothetical protein
MVVEEDGCTLTGEFLEYLIFKGMSQWIYDIC